MVISFLLLAVVVVIIMVLLISAGIKVEHEEGGDQVIKTVYLYLVLFATLMMSIGGSIGIFMAAADIISPSAYYQSFDEYRRYAVEGKAGSDGAKISEEEMLANYNSMVAAEKERQILRAKNSLIKSLGWVIIPLPVFLYFQRRLANKEV